MEIKSETNTRKLGRRNFVKTAGLTGLGLASAAIVAGKLGALDNSSTARALGLGSATASAAENINVEVLNFALNLEYLEAEFYTVATTGKTLEESGFALDGKGKSGPTTGGKQVNLEGIFGIGEVSGRLKAVAEEITYDEQQHVLLLRSLLGSKAVAKPALNLDALGYGFADFREFLKLARDFEDTGVSAYGGAAPLLTNTSDLAYAVRIGLTEALHVSNIRLLIAENHVETAALDSQDVLPPPSGSKYFTVDSQALSVVRTTSEVLAIVYGNSATGTDKGGFFPNGVNGAITTV